MASMFRALRRAGSNAFRSRHPKQIMRDRRLAACISYNESRGCPVSDDRILEHLGTMSGGNRTEWANSPSFQLMKTRLNRTIEFLATQTPDALQPSRCVADVGDASGLFLESLGKRGTSINVDPAALTLLRSRGFEVREYQAYDIQVEDSTFDYVLCLEVIEHLEDPIRALREIRRVSRSGIIASIPYVSSTRVRPLGYWLQGSSSSSNRLTIERDRHKYHVFEFCIQDFIAVSSQAGLYVKAYEPLIPYEDAPKWWLLHLVEA